MSRSRYYPGRRRDKMLGFWRAKRRDRRDDEATGLRRTKIPRRRARPFRQIFEAFERVLAARTAADVPVIAFAKNDQIVLVPDVPGNTALDNLMLFSRVMPGERVEVTPPGRKCE